MWICGPHWRAALVLVGGNWMASPCLVSDVNWLIGCEPCQVWINFLALFFLSCLCYVCTIQICVMHVLEYVETSFILWRHIYCFWTLNFLSGWLAASYSMHWGKKLPVGRQLLGGLGNNFSGLLSTSHEITCGNPLFQVSVSSTVVVFIFYLLKYYFFSCNCRTFSFGSHAIFFEILYCLDGW